MINVKQEGFIIKYILKSKAGICYTKKYDNHPKGYKNMYIDVLYIPNSSWVLISEGDDETSFEDWEVMFKGRILCQDDFIKVLEMVIINK